MKILESNESKVAVPVGFAVVVGFFVSKFLGNSNLENIIVPTLALILGLAVGWVLGEAFTYASGISKFLLGSLTTLFGTSVTLDQFRQQINVTGEKVFYLLSLVPISNPDLIDSIHWFSLAFIVAFVFSVGVNFTRRMEKVQKTP